MATINLTRGAVAVVDEEDLPLLAGYTWRLSVGGNGTRAAVAWTRRVAGCRRSVSMHRVIADAREGLVVDHVDGDQLNNRRANLRVCSHAENMRNSAKRRDNTTGVKGVYRLRDGRFEAAVKADGVRTTKQSKSLAVVADWVVAERLRRHGAFAADSSRTPRTAADFGCIDHQPRAAAKTEGAGTDHAEENTAA